MTPNPDALESRYDPALTVRVVESWPLPGVRAGSGLAWHGASLVDAIRFADEILTALSTPEV